MKVIGVQLTDLEIKAIDELVATGYFRSRSQLLREGLAWVLFSRKVKPLVRAAIEEAWKEHTPRRRLPAPPTNGG